MWRCAAVAAITRPGTAADGSPSPRAYATRGARHGRSPGSAASAATRPAAFRAPRSEPGCERCREPRRRRSATRPADCSGLRFSSRPRSGVVGVLPDGRVEQVDPVGRQTHGSTRRLPQASSRNVADTSGLSPLGFEVYSISASIASLRALPLIGGMPPFEPNGL